jgi:hypothetical protein
MPTTPLPIDSSTYDLTPNKTPLEMIEYIVLMAGLTFPLVQDFENEDSAPQSSGPYHLGSLEQICSNDHQNQKKKIDRAEDHKDPTFENNEPIIKIEMELYDIKAATSAFQNTMVDWVKRNWFNP